MSNDAHRDRLVDMLLWERIGNETPPDVRARVLEAAEREPRVPAVVRRPASRPVVLASAKASSVPRVLGIAAVIGFLAIAGLFVHIQNIAAARTPQMTFIANGKEVPYGELAAASTTKTGSSAAIKLTYPDGTVVKLAPDTEVRALPRSYFDASKGLALVRGILRAEVMPQEQDSPMVLTTKEASLVVVGTRFSFARGGNSSRLEVEEGAVRFDPRGGGTPMLVKDGYFAEMGATGFRHGAIPGIVRFTLMNAETDQPIRKEALMDGETIALSRLPTRKINIRADYNGNPPALVRIRVTHLDGLHTGLAPHTADPHEHPPYFVAGDHWADGRPEDCAAWTPPPGPYRLRAEAVYLVDGKETPSKPLTIDFRVTK